MLFHAATGTTSHFQLLFQIFDLHHARIHQENDHASKAQKAELAGQKRDKKKVIDLDHHLRMIDHHLLNDPVDKHPHRIAPRVMETKIKPRIAKIVEKATGPLMNLKSRCNALETLVKLAEAVIVNSVKSGVCINIMGYFFHVECIEEAMLAVWGVITGEERKKIAKEALWCEHVAAVMALGRTRKDYGRSEDVLFERLQEVLDTVGYREGEGAAERVEGIVAGMKERMRRSIPQSFEFRGGVRVPVPIPEWIIEGA